MAPPGIEVLKMGMSNNLFQTEIIYSFVIILCSLMIYFATKELYELSSYKGIKYFRESFLFFAIAFFFRSFIKIFFILANPPNIIGFSSALFQAFGMFIFIYFSSIAIFYLIYSMFWGKIKGNSGKIYLLHLFALIISIISILFNSARIYLLINLIIFIFIIIMIYWVYYYTRKQKRKKSNLYTIYILLFIFWFLNVLDILIPKFLQMFQLIIYLISICIFLIILYKVLKKAGTN
jgi:hypothetical protein